MKNSMVIYRSFLDAISDLPENEQLQVWNAILHFGFDGIEIELTGFAKTVFKLIKPQLEANNRKSEIGIANGEKGAKFGKLGGRPPKEKPANNPQKTPNGVIVETPKKPANDNVNDNVNNNANENENIPPPKKNEIAWWKNATRSDIEKKIEPYLNNFPKSFIDEFIDHYAMPNEEGGININHLRSFEIESFLRKWWADPKTKTKHTQQIQRLPDELTSKPNEDLAARIERTLKYAESVKPFNPEQGY